MHHLLRFSTRQAQELLDITEQVAPPRAIRVANGLVTSTPGARPPPS